jgi:hypothetical protein
MATKAQKMSELAIIQSENFSTGTVKRPGAVMMAAHAAGQDILSLLKLFNFKGYSMRVVFYSPAEIKLLVFNHVSKDKDTKVKTTTSIRQEIVLTCEGKMWSASGLFDDGEAAKLAGEIIPTKLHDYPIIPLANVGFYPKDHLVSTLSMILQKNYTIKTTEADQTAVAMLSYTVDRELYMWLSPKELVKTIETEAIAALRHKEFLNKQDKKALASATQS